MMVSPSELSLDCKPHSYSTLQKCFGDLTDQTQKLEEFVARLEEERLKIDAFKRELPLCMQLLTNAMEALRQQLQTNGANQGPRPVLEEFIPLKHSSSEGSEKATNMSDKADWMTSAQLWSQASEEISKPQNTIISPKTEICFGVSAKLALDDKQRSGGAFHPFSKERNSCHTPTLLTLPDLALASPNKEMEDKKLSEAEIGISYSRIEIPCNGGNGAAVIQQGKGADNPAEGETATTTTTTQTHRKARRCWSPELHRRFVNALQMLGGSQVATPKQIRELMKVDGLTNDEVKSHLQKYRLHTRRPSPSPQAAGTQAPHLVVLGGIWVPQDYSTAAAAAAHGGAPTLYGAHPAAHPSSLYCGPPVPQEFYPAPPQHHQQLHHHHALHHQLQVYKASSPTHSLPESDVRGVGDRSESIEDGRSTSGSWKGDSCGNNGGGERRMLALREEGDQESNGSLKY